MLGTIFYAAYGLITFLTVAFLVLDSVGSWAEIRGHARSMALREERAAAENDPGSPVAVRERRLVVAHRMLRATEKWDLARNVVLTLMLVYCAAIPIFASQPLTSAPAIILGALIAALGLVTFLRWTWRSGRFDDLEAAADFIRNSRVRHGVDAETRVAPTGD